MPRSSEHLHTEQCFSFAIWQVAGHGLATMRWRYGDQIRVDALLCDEPDEARVRLAYTVNGGGLQQRMIGLTYTRPNYGGRRPWLVCPGCGRRIGRLFMPVGGAYAWSCRHCLGLRYHVQRLSPEWRLRAKADKIQWRLGGEVGAQADFPDKPKGMHWRTYHKRFEQWQDAVDRQLAIEAAAIARWTGGRIK